MEHVTGVVLFASVLLVVVGLLPGAYLWRQWRRIEDPPGRDD